MNQMTINKPAVKAGLAEAAIQLIELVPGLASLVEGIRAYHEHVEDQQRRAFVQQLANRVETLEQNRAWYSSSDGEVFIKKVVATALNAEYADKLDFLVNAFVNGPSLGNDNAKRMKFVEMIRQLSKPALEVLIASVRLRPRSDEVVLEELAAKLKWHSSLVDACIREIHSVGGFSPITKWETSRDGKDRVMARFMDNQPGLSPLTREFAQFLTSGKQ
ncbi:MAG: hypothetical protein EDM74_06705 [Armatimonadetes bacterium]|nr:MAG: hypothetical protein EDM74_06705 [Armatimonadota bacterium]